MKDPQTPTLDELKVRGAAAMRETRVAIDAILEVAEINRRLVMGGRSHSTARKRPWLRMVKNS